MYTNTVPGMNKVKSPVSYFLGQLYKSTFIYHNNYGGSIGIAKDGHVIYGPYNKDGELWSCTDTDYCNGFFLSDYSYGYASTAYFPYNIGCWGPAPAKQFVLSCSQNSCNPNGSSSDSISLGVSFIASLLVFA